MITITLLGVVIWLLVKQNFRERPNPLFPEPDDKK